MIRHQVDLVKAIKAYDPQANEQLICRAYDFSLEAHSAQIRASGDPYFTHPLEVAEILIAMHLDVATIVTALLHDTVEDTVVTLEEIHKLFGQEVAFLVDGVTKLSQIEFQSDKAKQAENFRKLLLAMSSDIRVLLVKLADRLHNMRTLHHKKSEEKKRKVALETMEIYAPLAERIGLDKVKDELFNLSFAVLYPNVYQSIVTRLNFLQEKGGDLVPQIIEELQTVLKKNDIVSTVMGRKKTPYSIWGKMQKKNVGFEQLSDIIAFRVVVDNVGDCYRALGVIHSQYPVIPGRFKDYISTPKQNNYKSLHTAIIGPHQHRIEIQIRTQEMDRVAELGVAAHWQYKQGISHEGNQYPWLRGLLDILENAESPEDFLEHTKLEMFQDQVFCFTPLGDLITLPRGATAIDFAYAVHSVVGNRCTGVRINGRVMPLRTELKNGDQVEVTTSKSQHPSPTWERFVVTGKARASIRRFIRSQRRQQFINLGKSLVQKSFRGEHLEFHERYLERAFDQFNARSIDDIYAQIGEGLHTTQELIRFFYPEYKQTVKQPTFDELGEVSKKNRDETALSLSGLIPGMAVHYAGCCHPVPGDKIVGIVITGKGVTIHTFDCDTLEKLRDEPERWIDVTWNDQLSQNEKHISRLSMIVMHQPGTIAAITAIIAKQEANILNIKTQNRTPEFYEVQMDLDVRHLGHLSDIMAALRMSSKVISVERSKS